MVLFILGCGTVLWAFPSENAALDKAFDLFWEAKSRESRAGAVKRILDTNPTFEEVYTRLKDGRAYSVEVKRGRRTGSRAGLQGLKHSFVFYVPKSYDPSKRYQVTFYLHGGIMAQVTKPDWWWRFAREIYKEDRIVVFPISWNKSRWWQYSQVENLRGILDRLKQQYNIDENRVYMFGVSDGATGLYYLASKDTTPWAGFVPVIGSPGVMNHPGAGADGEMFTVNVSIKPFLVVNCGRDPLYPVKAVKPFVELFRSAGCDIQFLPKPHLGHNALWWDKEEKLMETFMREHPRVPLPDRLVWETEDIERFGRAHWLVITRLGVVKGESKLKSWNVLELGKGQFRKAFVHKLPSGRVELKKKGNIVYARTQGVKEFKLLLSPETFDFQNSVQVFTNGVRVFSGKVVKDPEVLLRWAARDSDRTMLFGAELIITVQAPLSGQP